MGVDAVHHLRPALQALGREQQDKPQKVTLTLCSFAVSRRAYQRITERFAAEYEAATGQPIKFRLSFGGSGTQVGQPAC